MLSSALTAATMCGPLLSITHSARSPIAASVISARDGWPFFASDFSTSVAQMSGFADPKHLFLHFCEPLVSALHCKVAASDHYAHRIMSHRGHDQIWQALE